MESATFEWLETTVAIAVLILGTSENRLNVTSLQQSRGPPLIHPLGQPQPQPWRRVLRTMYGNAALHVARYDHDTRQLS